MLSRLVRQFLFTFIHLVVNILVAVKNVYLQLFIYKSHIPTCRVSNKDIQALIRSSPKMQKQLNHIVVLADTNFHCMSDLARLVIWSLVLGVPYISFYDITGNLKSSDEDLFMEIQKNKKGIPGCIRFSNKPNLNGYTNGSRSNTIVINIFSAIDGKHKIAKCIQKVANNSSIEIESNKELTAQDFDEMLVEFYPSIPDPDIIMYTGHLCCTYGCLPWQIRLSEFILLSSSHIVNVDNYINAIYKYNKCDRRFGK